MLSSWRIIFPRSKYYGPDATCTIDTCNVIHSVYEYRPSLAANATLLSLFALVLVIQTGQCFKWRSWSFFAAMALGCLTEILGYAGRILLYINPFDFNGFLMQIVCLTIGPVFFSGAIYITLSKIVNFLDPRVSRFPAQFFYWIFISCDIISLVLQASGGAMSSDSGGSSQTGVDIALAGLAFQVFTLVIFIALAMDYAIRYTQAQNYMQEKPSQPLSTRFKVFCAFLTAAILLILIRCAYRIDELSNGYSGPLIHDEGLFIALEGVMIIAAAFCLIVAHPGPILGRNDPNRFSVKGSESA